MRLSKRQLKRIIREEYSKLKRRGLIKESAWQMNPNMGGPEDQDCQEGTSIEDCAKGWAEAMMSDYGVDAIADIQDFVRPSSRGGAQDVISMCQDESDAGYACMDSLEGMDIEGSGNWPHDAAAAALADAFIALR